MSSGIEIQHLSKQYEKKTILHDINLKFEPKTIYGLLGRNGAGKSTLLGLISDRIFPTQGRILFNAEMIHDNDQILGQFYLMSEVDLYPNRRRVRQLFRDTEQLYGEFNRKYADELVKKFGLDDSSQYGKLSTGYRTIVKLIIALCVPATYIFLDEPVLGLDANHRDIFYRELVETYTERPRTFVISTHLIEEIANLIEQVVVIKSGRVLVDDSSEALIAESYAITGPKNVVDSFVSGLNVIGSETLGNLKAAYVFGALDDRPIPDVITIEHMDLQKLFVNLTNEEETQNDAL
ncbi:ATP-binding cassette domain-containing protein [Levilactobacillus bambusae]|uniref:ABC transporter ATP-binding protein n=1 Tax=Levilactobacillus bambusae TaxID=2024736 RepID=A0A2V1MWT6_9LACO|nr:ABC transporter ATP-binding protein [Levilactobacillus bambusae]PWF99540.1 ABC transporter ATP-binding protein [Levilactobacillus bambusae]